MSLITILYKYRYEKTYVLSFIFSFCIFYLFLKLGIPDMNKYPAYEIYTDSQISICYYSIEKSLLLPIIPAISTWQFTYFHIIFILIFLILYKKTNIFAEKRRNYVFWF